MLQFVLVGFLGGVLGGMGMGGGTILIPLLTIFLKVSQINAQAVNLIAFIPMSIVALRAHYKNGYVQGRQALKLIVPAVVFCVLGALVAKKLDQVTLKKFFGLFLIALSLFLVITTLKNKPT